MISTLAELNAYLFNIGEQHPDINEVIIGDSEQILAIDRSKINYPCLWIETPSVNWHFGNNPDRNYQLFFVVLENTAIDNWAHQQHILDRCLTITEHILAIFQSDHEVGNIRLDRPSADSSPILGYGHDNDYGWRTQLSVKGLLSSCPAACHAVGDCAPYELAAFSYSNNNTGDFTDLSIIDNSSVQNPTAVEWLWQVDNATPVTSPIPPTNIGAGNYLYLQLKITKGNCTRYASIYLLNNQLCATSTPSIINKNYC